MSTDLPLSAPSTRHIVVVILGKAFLACLGLAIGLVAGMFIALSIGLIQIGC